MIEFPKEPSGTSPFAAWGRTVVRCLKSVIPLTSPSIRANRGTNGTSFEFVAPQTPLRAAAARPFEVKATDDPTIFNVAAGKAIMPLLFPTSTTQDIFNPEFCFLRYDYPGGTVTIDDWTDIPSTTAHSFCVLWLELKQDDGHPETVTPSLVKQFSDGANTFIVANAGKGAPPVMTRLDDSNGATEFFCIPLARIEATSLSPTLILESSEITQYQSVIGHALQHAAGDRCLRHCGGWRSSRLYQPYDMVTGSVSGGFPTPNWYFNTAVNDNNAPGASINRNYATGDWVPL